MARKMLFAVVAVMFVINCSYAKIEDDATATTLKNLQSAYQGETDANQFYRACAEKADQEGYQQAASLFRAAAYSESIHAKNHAEVIHTMGVKPEVEQKKPDIKSTEENVTESYKDEKEESTKMYPEFVKQAQAAGNVAAVRTFTFAQAAEAQHAKYFKETMENLKNWRSGPKTFLVCTVCGYTTDELTLKSCPICSTAEKFKEIK